MTATDRIRKVACPSCGASVGDNCRVSGILSNDLHARRVRAALKAERDHEQALTVDALTRIAQLEAVGREILENCGLDGANYEQPEYNRALRKLKGLLKR